MAARKEDASTIEPHTHNEGPDLTLEEIEQIIRQFKDSDLPHLYYRQGDSIIELKRKASSESCAQSFSLPVNSSVPNPQTYNIYIPGPDPSMTNPYVSPTLSGTEEKRQTSTTMTEEQTPKVQTAPPTKAHSEESNEQHSAPQTNLLEVAIVSKRVGRFRRGRSKKKPFVEVGDHVKLKQPVCVIEQLGLEHVYFSEVEGVIDKILVQDGDPVEYGQKLMTVSTKL